MIAMALVHNPDVLIADEPTTALDVTVQAQILELIDRVKKEFDVGVILITHDLGVVAETATHVMVMYAGRAMEYGPAARSSTARSTRTRGACSSRCRRREAARHAAADRRLAAVAAQPAAAAARSIRAASTGSRPVTASVPPLDAMPGGHLDALPLPPERKRELWQDRDRRGRGSRERRTERSAPRRPPAHGAPLIEIDHLTKHFPVKQGVFARGKDVVHAVEDVSLTVTAGETLGIVGESGCGKSTTARLMVRLIDPTSGTIRFDGVDITHFSRRAMRPLRQEMQIIFQDPYSSLNPRKSVGQIIGEPFAIHRTEKDVKSRVRSCSPASG